jgi:hypothetical protein
MKIIDEVHFWNNTRNAYDECYIKSITNLKRTSSAKDGNYVIITPKIIDNSFEIKVNARSDFHIKINGTYEIVLGGWDNTKSVIREIKENNVEIFQLIKPILENDIIIKVSMNDYLSIYKNNELIIHQPIENVTIEKIQIKTGHNSVGEIDYTPTQNQGFYFMDTCEKTWKNYYQYYTNTKYANDIILKCDDDIVFMDIYKLPKFIEFIKNNDFDLVFANTINNGVSSFFQQHRYNLIPTTLMNLEYPNEGLYGTLWESGEKAEKLHNYFIQNNKKFLLDRGETIQINTRFSINFFGYKGKNWHKIKDCYIDDEYNLTVDYVKNRKFKNIFYSDFYVSHLSFYKQNETINLYDLVNKYDDLYNKIWNSQELNKIQESPETLDPSNI